MPTDRDTLARDLLTLPALVGAPVEVVRGLCFVSPDGLPWSITETVGSRWVLYSDDVGLEEEPAALHAAGWRVDLDAWGSAGPLLRLLGPDVGFHCGDPTCPTPWLVQKGEHEGEGATLAEAAARALMEVARGR